MPARIENLNIYTYTLTYKQEETTDWLRSNCKSPIKTKSHDDFSGDEVVGPEQVDQIIQVDMLARPSDTTEVCPETCFCICMCFIFYLCCNTTISDPELVFFFMTDLLLNYPKSSECKCKNRKSPATSPAKPGT